MQLLLLVHHEASLHINSTFGLQHEVLDDGTKLLLWKFLLCLKLELEFAVLIP